MHDQELRALVRDAVARHLSVSQASEVSRLVFESTPSDRHSSHAIYLTVVNIDHACVIEPDVRCHHCQYCKSHGH